MKQTFIVSIEVEVRTDEGDPITDQEFEDAIGQPAVTLAINNGIPGRVSDWEVLGSRESK